MICGLLWLIIFGGGGVEARGQISAAELDGVTVMERSGGQLELVWEVSNQASDKKQKRRLSNVSAPLAPLPP